MSNEQNQSEANAHPVDTLVKLHWYCLTYVGNNIEGTPNATGSTYAGFETNNITLSKINDNKRSAGMDRNSVLIACMYLGEMTRSEFTI